MIRALTVGLGCRRGSDANDIEQAVRHALGDHDLAHVRQVATIAAKLGEPGLIDFCRRHDVPLVGVEAAAIVALPSMDRAESPVAQRRFGVGAVCEPCALIASGGGHLIVRKTAWAGVTVAIASAPAP